MQYRRAQSYRRMSGRIRGRSATTIIIDDPFIDRRITETERVIMMDWYLAWRARREAERSIINVSAW